MNDLVDYRTAEPVLGTLLDPGADAQARTLTLALAADRDAPAHFVSPTADATELEVASAAEPVERVADVTDGDAVSTGVFNRGGSPHQVVADDAAAVDATVVAVQRQRDDHGRGIRRDAADRVVAHSPTDTVVANGRGDIENVSSVLVPVAGGPHTDLTVATARALARYAGAWVELFHVVSPDPSADERSRGADHLADARRSLGGFEEYDTWLYEADDPAEAIVEQSAYYDAVVMGAPTKGRLKRFVFGSTVDAVDRSVDVPVVTAHRDR